MWFFNTKIVCRLFVLLVSRYRDCINHRFNVPVTCAIMKGRWNLSHPFTEHCKQQEDDDTIMNQLPDSVMKLAKVQRHCFSKLRNASYFTNMFYSQPKSTICTFIKHFHSTEFIILNTRKVQLYLTLYLHSVLTLQKTWNNSKNDAHVHQLISVDKLEGPYLNIPWSPTYTTPFKIILWFWCKFSVYIQPNAYILFKAYFGFRVNITLNKATCTFEEQFLSWWGWGVEVKTQCERFSGHSLTAAICLSTGVIFNVWTVK